MFKKMLSGILFLALLVQVNAATSVAEVVRFATLAESQELLSAEDEFTDSWSAFDIDSRMHAQGTTKNDLLKYTSTQAREWTDAEQELLTEVFNEIDRDLESQGLSLTLPERIYFVKTTTLEEGSASAYTRATYVVLHEDFVDETNENLKHVVCHEIFHVLSRNNPEFRKALYAIIGFSIMEPIEYPAAIRDSRITNPDAPQTDHFVNLSVDGRDVDCMMVIYANAAYTDGDFFDYMKFGFLELDKGKKPVIKSGMPVIHSIDTVNGFFEQVGQNTRYIIHPEEILADNFAFAVVNRSDLPDQRIIKAIQEELRLD